MLVTLLACAPRAAPVPVGTIPEARPVTPEEEQHGHKVLSALTKEYELDYSHPRYQAVLDIVERLTASINAGNEPWHVYLLKDPNMKNAAATRGNHIFVWTGMLDATQNNDELAAVLGHEIGHVLARHTDGDPNENLRRTIVDIASVAAGVAVAVATENPTLGQNAGRLTSGLSRELGNAIAVYPYSREREYEADHIGLFLMAKAGYDPSAAVRFWQRAMNDPGFSSNLAFFSTHPPAAARLERLKTIVADLQQPSSLRGRGIAPSAGGTVANVPLRTGGSVSQGRGPSGARAGRDTFDVSAIVRENREFIEWRVISDKAVVYEDSHPQARRLGEFRHGALVLGMEQDADWIRIESHDAGFIRAGDLRRTIAR